jgi:DNA-binding LytR/AlgR family response regulator
MTAHSTAPVTALIAEDEPLLAAALQAELALAWPELNVVAVVGNGTAAVAQALHLQPDVLFFDIRMPGLNGLAAATELADQWPVPAQGSKAFPALVFVTAYEQYAVQAFEAQAMDYVLKPVQPARLEKTVLKLQQTLANRVPSPEHFEATLSQLRSLLQATSAVPAPAEWLKMMAVSVGQQTRMLAMSDIVYFEAADKYVRVLSASHEYLIRTPIKELLPQLDPQTFWQIHRSTVVNAACVDSVSRDELGKLSLSLRGRPERLKVSRLYAHRFKAL